MYALEYGASDEGSEHSKQSWPHSEWSTLVAAITDNTNNSSNNNNRDLGDVDTLRGLTSLFRGTQGIPPLEGLDTRTVASGPRVSYGQQSIHCIESISDSMWLVAILKDLDQPTGRWQWQSPRPTTERMEDDLRDLVSNLASMIRISDRFDAPSVRLLREKFLERSSDDEIGAGLAEELNERGIDLTEMGAEKIAIWIKNQLKVLAQSTNASRNGAALGTTSRLLRRKLRRRGTKPMEVGHAESAAAFFLGKDLMHTIVFDFY
jgi:hypothetical protein